MEKQKEFMWYQKSSGIVILLIIFFPVGLYLMWKNELWTKKTRWIVTGILAIIFIVTASNDRSRNSGSESDSKNPEVTFSDDTNKSSSEEWYVGGALHKATISEWKSATEKNKLATCADFVANVKKTNHESYNGDLVSMKNDATQMMNCIDVAVKGAAAENANMRVNEVAAACAILLEGK
jgi:hypothetical protein